MDYNFDTIISRSGTDSLKYDYAEKKGMPGDILPLWVADMDFQAPPEVLEVLQERIRHGIFGYSDAPGDDYFSALEDWYVSRFAWRPSKRSLIKIPGVVFAVNAAIRALTGEGEAVLIQEPVYYPFAQSIQANNRHLAVNELIYENGAYTIDLEAFERIIIDKRVKLFILCSPHNPVGRVWTLEELTAMGDICLKHGVYVVADEIHADFVYPGYKHTVFAGIKPEFAHITITCTAPTKTFNLAGLQISNIFIENVALRRKVKGEIGRTGYSQPNLMGLIACRAAYQYGAPWLEALKAYLARNLEFTRTYLAEHIPAIRLVEPQGTYLIWLDCRALGLDDKALDELMVQKARLWLDGGTMFGSGGEGFQRVNIACPRETLETALARLKEAVDARASSQA